LKKRIKIITYGNFPFGGASANFLRNMGTGFNQNNCDVEVLLPKGNYFGKKIEQASRRLDTIKNVRYRFFCFTRHPLFYIGKLIDNLFGPFFLFLYLFYHHLIIDKIDFIIKYNITFSSQLALLIISKSLRIKLINVIPEFYEKPKSGFLSLAKWKNFYFGIRYLAKLSNGLIVLTTYLENYIRKQNQNIPILVHPNIVDPDTFRFPDSKKELKELRIGYSGTPTKKDGILDLLQSFKVVSDSFDNISLLVIGDITNGTSVVPNLIEFCKNLGIENKVDFTGLVPFSKIPELLHSCDILVLARPEGVFAEAGFPTKLGEYFACKIPVVITTVGDINYYFKDTNSVVLVEPGNIKSISNGILDLILNPKKREEIGENGFLWMKENLDYIKVAKKCLEFVINID
jgi:glycosyltransferase involved in cell wall biosynthesis